MGEDEAFRLLRGASMHTNLRVGEVSRSVIEAAQWAEAINRAGQLRMLSQRLVKLAAQRLAGADARRARGLLDEAIARAQDNLDRLASLLPADAAAPAGVALARAQRAWLSLRTDLQAALLNRRGVALLAAVDLRAEALLEAAETLTEAMQTAGARRALHIINLCGRQRMRVQRLAKDALLAALLHEPERRAGLPALMDAFEAALRELAAAPLSSDDIRAGLAEASEEWLRLLRALRGSDDAQSQAQLAGASDALLDIFDRLTAAYEHSLQVIMS
jgi:nitrate/nitrite-specific signal transduction histidine kinase